MKIFKGTITVLFAIVFIICFIVGVSYLFNAGLIFTNSADLIYGEPNKLNAQGQETGEYQIYERNLGVLENMLIFLNKWKAIFIVIAFAALLYMIYLSRETGILQKVREMIEG